MLSYAFTTLNSKGYKDMSAEEFDNAADLLTDIITRGINHQVRRGLKRDYDEITESLLAIRGKIEITASINDNCITQGRLVCTHDEYSINTPLNQIVKTAGTMLLKSDASKLRKRLLRRALDFLSDVDIVNPKDIDWHNKFNRNDHTYRMLIFVCKLAIDGMIHCKDTGSLRLEDFDEANLAHLFEHFVLEYYKREHSVTVSASSPTINWALDDDFDDMLPSMRTDITLVQNQASRNTLIIDTKFYSSNMQIHFDKQTIRSANLYQIFTYVKNKEIELAHTDSQVSGMLLYARTDSELQPDATYQMNGTPISIKTLDLNQPFEHIRAQLDSFISLLD